MAFSTLPGPVKAVKKASETPTITRGPYLQRCHTSGIVLMWYTDIPCESNVRFGTEVNARNLSFTIDGQRRSHVVRLNGLSGNTKYFYSIGTVDTVLAGGTAEYYFKTAPTAEEAISTRIWVLGDSGNPNDTMRAVRDSYYVASPGVETDLCIMLGDNAYPYGTEDNHQLAVFDMFESTLRTTPLWPTYGNHDALCEDCVSAEQLGAFFSIFKTPTQGESGGIPSNRRDFYSFDYGDTHFVCLNSHDGFGSHMLEWLEQDLEANEKTWLIAFFHHPPYSKGYHDSDTDPQLITMRSVYLPVLEAFGVDLVLTGHNHSYERSYLINNHYGTSDSLEAEMILDDGDGSPTGDGAYVKKEIQNGGTVYVAMGCASQLKEGALNHPAMVKSLMSYGSLALDISGRTMSATFLDEQGVIQDSFQIYKAQEGESIYLPLIS